MSDSSVATVEVSYELLQYMKHQPRMFNVQQGLMQGCCE